MTGTGTETETETGPETAPAGSPEVTFGVDLSRGFTEWLATKRIGLAMTTYQVGKLIMFGLDEKGQLWSYNRNIPRCLGLYVDGDGFRVTGDVQLIRFDIICCRPVRQVRTARMRSMRRASPALPGILISMMSPGRPRVRRSSPTRCSTAWRDPACHMVSGRSGNRTSFPGRLRKTSVIRTVSPYVKVG